MSNIEQRLQILETKALNSKPITDLDNLVELSSSGDLLVVYSAIAQKPTKTDLQNLITLLGLEPTTGTPPTIGTFEVALNNFFGVDYSGTTTALTTIEIATGTVLGGNARIKGNWATKPTVTGATEAENSSFIANQVIYLYFESWSDGILYWFSNN